MSYFQPTYIRKYESGLVQSRQNFIIPDDAYPVLENAFIWRERILKKPGYKLLGRLRRTITAQALGVALDGSGAISNNIKTLLSLETNADIEPGSVSISDGTNTYTDDSAGVLTGAPGGSGTINYSTMAFTISGGAAAGPLTATFNYFPSLPVMGLKSRELNNINAEQMVAFDTKYAYVFNSGFQEFITGTTWSGNDSDFFWSTNWYVGDNNAKIFWVTNFSGISGDPIRYTNGTSWIDFTPQIDTAGNMLFQCQAILPFRGRLLTLNTYEGATLGTSVNYRQRIRWSQIGTPFSTASAIVTTVVADAWRDDVPGKGGFLDIPTAENIISAGFVRDNLVIFCEKSTWQLRYTGRSIAPFQIEKVNTELGAESPFSSVQFDTSLVGIGDKGVVECDSYKSERIDVKIPDLTFTFNNDANGTKRVHGIRDFQQRIAYWCYPETGFSYPNKRLVYNYENDSWAIFKDSFTTFGTHQPQQGLRWIDFPGPEDSDQWQSQNYAWLNRSSQFPLIVGGNQQGYVEILGQENFQFQATNDPSLTIKGITGNTTTATELEITNHNLETGQVIQVENIPTGTPFASSLNDGVFGIVVTGTNTIELYQYNSDTGEFSTPQTDASATYIGGGNVIVRDNFIIQSKKFNYLDQGQSIQFGFMDILVSKTTSGDFTLNIYTNYNDSEPQNRFPQNNYEGSNDPFFNQSISTTTITNVGQNKTFQRLHCPVRGSFITLEFTFSNAQMAGDDQNNFIEIDAQVLWMRPAGRQLTTF